MNNKITLNVSIAAYNSEKTIEKLINTILMQKQTNFKFESIVIHSDCSSDNTVKIVKKMKSNLLHIIDAKKRLGYDKAN